MRSTRTRISSFDPSFSVLATSDGSRWPGFSFGFGLRSFPQCTDCASCHVSVFPRVSAGPRPGYSEVGVDGKMHFKIVSIVQQ
jgi:hypothetical protein